MEQEQARFEPRSSGWKLPALLLSHRPESIQTSNTNKLVILNPQNMMEVILKKLQVYFNFLCCHPSGLDLMFIEYHVTQFYIIK